MNYIKHASNLSRRLEGLPLNQQSGYIRLCNRFAPFLGSENRDIEILAVPSVFVNPIVLFQEALRACLRPLIYCRHSYSMVAALSQANLSIPGRLDQLRPGISFLQLNTGKRLPGGS